MYTKPVLGLLAIRSARFLEIIHGYEMALTASGYKPLVVRFHLHAVAHFGVWLEQKGTELGKIHESTLAEFERHRPRCRCPGTSRSRQKVVCCIRIFLRHLRKQGIVPAAEPPKESSPLVADFLQWMAVQRGPVETTLSSYRIYVTSLIDFLGDDPQTYTAKGLREFIADRYRHYGSNSIRMVLAAVRMLLRYLAGEGRCRAGLDQALLSSASWALQSLPQGLTSEEVQRVLMQCATTPAGIRDRAVLLLLSRLGLRAGDVAALRLEDICFETATIKVLGKGKREVRLPLPQEVGDAILEYLRDGRPRVENDHLFLRSIAPFSSFAAVRPGHAVTHIARSALRRAGVQRRQRGSHVFRHTAACHMLAADVSLENIAAVLRHRSIETTGIYAKVDLHSLRQAAQPWPEETSC
jgi:site-specific recombinase XerD